ncbi:cytochrome P450 monooxygenase-like protein [Westerdykella ornata]|uniref:Cytochrome P450 monooxygenase-like protein n=1 Tax=Westerdykella ornata TaxID=318751 RepID=A0A6A6J8Q4_WESOR|nr:cytochrome P450 monooxygenase-like protein [Westerdykella ornata]KAF2271589.1 cytochrome P450 monooxygenase-like protein [Westerdykella ornata]
MTTTTPSSLLSLLPSTLHLSHLHTLIALSLLLLSLIYILVSRPARAPPSPSSTSHLTISHIPPAHPLAPYTSLWISTIRFRGRENRTLKEAHDRLGPVVRLGPKEVSVNCVRGGIREVYGGGFEKGDWLEGYNWYAFFGNYGGVPNMFSTPDNKTHSRRKRMISNIYSKSVVTTSPYLKAQISTILYNRFLPYLSATFSGDRNPSDAKQEPGVLNISPLLYATTMDIVTGYIFGLSSSSNLIDNPDELSRFLSLYNSRRSYNFWPQEYPRLTTALRKWFRYRLSPQWVDDANDEIEKWTEAMCDGAARVLEQSDIKPEDVPVVYQQLSTALAKEAKKSGLDNLERKYELASEVLDHLAAGFDTSGITLTYVIHELSRNPEIQEKLRAELLTLSPPLVPSSTPSLPDAKAVDSLPLLHAVIWETLRLHSAIPGPQPRFTPPQGCRLGPDDKSYYVPGGVRVSASAGLLHLNEDVYERASEWRPQRWLEDVPDEKRKDMESRWFWAGGQWRQNVCWQPPCDLP